MNRVIDMRLALLFPLFVSQIPFYANAAVLDPAIYLYPSPPFPTSGEENALWTRASKSTKVKQYVESTTESKDVKSTTTNIIEEEFMEEAETFWPKLRSIDYVLKQVHVPVTFSISGNYGGYKGAAGVIGKTYANIGGTSLFSYGKSALAGTGYGNYGSPVRTYGGHGSATWSGWGNGKWGHYGKG